MVSSQASAKKQQSISSFFKNRAPPAQPAAQSAPSKTSPIDDDGELFLSSDEGNEKPKSKGQGQKIASHALAANREDRHTDDEYAVDLPARKRMRLSDHSEEQNGAQGPMSPLEGRHDSKDTHDAHNVLTITSANGVKKAAHKQTSKYAFSSSPIRGEDPEAGDDEMDKRSKEALHAKFVKKLGRPDSIAEIKRRNWLVTEETQDELMEEEEDDGMGEDPKPAKKPSKAVASKKGASKLTPMEKQFLDIKRKHLDTLLVVEVGYKFKFFGEDARLAARELSIVCIPGKMRYDEHSSEAHYDKFASASIPVHRLHVHVKRLVSAGLKVGVVRQIETAALKAAGDNRNAPFVRKLTNLYTKGTYIDDVEGLSTPAVAPAGSTSATGYLLCMTETNANGWGTDEKVHVGMIAVQPATGDIIYDDFEDGFMRSEMETRLLHIAPCEILVVGELSKGTDKLVSHISGTKTNVFGDKVRLEKTEKPKTMAASAYSHVANFYAGKVDSEENSRANKTLDKVLRLAESTTICLSAMITHLAEYGLEHVFDLTKYFQSFSARSHMLLNGTSLTSLEIYQNQTDHTEKGSLFWTLNRTKTRFGQRLLRTWVGRPLLIKPELEERIAAVEELKEGQQSVEVDKITYLLSQIRIDLEKSLIRIYYGKCTRPELLAVLQTLQKIANEYSSVQSAEEAGFQSVMINNAIAVLPTIAGDVVGYLEQINLEAAKGDDKYSFFRDEMENDDITAHKLGIASVEQDLDAHRAVAAEKLKRKKVEYVTSSAIEYLIEIDNGYLKNVPASWAKISGTKKVSRFHTPEVVRFIRERDQHREALAAACDTAFSRLLNEISAQYQSLRDCVQALGVLDCLQSLAAVASQPGYVKPEFTDSTCIRIDQGRHPMVEQLLLDTYVPNDTNLASAETRALLITGPNMGGKSSYVRQVALISIMGQIGSYIPAHSATLGMLDGVFTRMGALDNMMAGESTFMVELSETSDILKQATPRSLILLDELGRGTSTHDGVAIAHAVLDHLVRSTRCLTLFITHYQHLSAAAARFPHAQLRNAHMRFSESAGSSPHQHVTFLYEVAEGVAHRSYGLNVARLANVPAPVLQVAAVKSREMEEEARSKGVGHLSRALRDLFQPGVDDGLEDLVDGIEQL